jgi:predicted RNase H-like nuclease (RuvC/YqgF family)
LDLATKQLESSTVSAKEPFSDQVPALDQLTAGIRRLEQWYAADFERRVVGLTELLQGQITAELRSQYSSELASQVDIVRRQYEERIYAQSSQSQHLEKENEDLRQQLKRVSQEIDATEATLSKSSSNLEMEGVVTDAASLGKLLQTRVEELEMRSYLRGLKFAFSRNVFTTR